MPKFLQAELGDCTGKGFFRIWPEISKLMVGTASKEFPALSTFTALTQRTAALVIMGEELCENTEFNRNATAYFNGTFTTGLAILMLPLGPLRPFFGRAVAWFQRRRQLKIIDEISPVLQRRMDERKKSPEAAARNLDAIEWTLRLLPEWPMNPAETQPLTRISEELIQNLWASGASPGMTITNMIFQILDDTSTLEALRTEAEAAVAKHGWSDKIVNSLILQDSFIREIHRLRPTFASTYYILLISLRRTLTIYVCSRVGFDNELICCIAVGCTRTIMNKPFEFSDGMVLPAGTRIGFPVKPSQIDSTVFQDPLDMQPFRFLKLARDDVRNDEGVNIWAASHADATNFAYVYKVHSSDIENTNHHPRFGYGNHVCPGPFFGVRVIKVVFTRLILEYDISWSRTEKGLPNPFTIEGINTPNPMQVILRRKTSST